MGIRYCDGERLRRAFLAGSRRVVEHRAELDRINVFPVPDGDTGTNLALTVREMARSVAHVRERSITAVAHRLADAGVLAARGNSGMMLSHFFLGFAEGLGDRARAHGAELASALRRAVDSLYEAVDEPVEGTLLTVAREATDAVHGSADRLADLRAFARTLLRAADESLARTPELLPSLRAANVVDAGAKGFVRFLEGVVGLVEGREEDGIAFLSRSIGGSTAPPAEAAVPGEDGGFRYCSEYIVRGARLPERVEMAEAVRTFGDSLIITRASELAKIHIHTDRPERVERALADLGGDVECVKAEDMHAQQRRRRAAVARPARVVTDTTCDLPTDLLIEHDIEVVPLTVSFGDETFVDQLEITTEAFATRLVDPGQPHPTTSQPAPRDFERVYRHAAEDAEEIVGIFLSGALSGTLAQARTAAARLSDTRIRVIDSRTASLGLGFQVLRAAELALAGHTAGAIATELERLRGRSGILFTLDTLEYLRRSGRVGRAKAFLAGMLDLKPIVSLDHEGVLVPVDRARGRAALVERVLELLQERVPAERDRLRIGVVHVLAPDVAERVAARVRSTFGPDDVLVRPATSVLAAHTGPGAWAVIYQAE